MSTLQLAIPGFTYSDLYKPSKLAELHSLFLTELQTRDSALHSRWKTYSTSGGNGLTPVEISQILVDMAPHIGSFVAKLFGIEKNRKAGMDLAAREKIIFKFKQDILQRQALKKYPTLEKCIEAAPLAELKDFYYKQLKTYFADNFISYDDELATAMMAQTLLDYQKNSSAELTSLGLRTIEKFLAFCAAREYDEELHKEVKHWASYHLPMNMDYSHLVEIIHPDELLKEKFIGPEDEDFKESKLHSLQNVFFLGAKIPKTLPAYIAAFDVCINPQLISEVTIGNYPRKVDEYLAMGKPVVATKTPAMEIFKQHTYLAESYNDYCTLIQTALSEDNLTLQQQRKDFASQHTWEKSVNEIYAAIINTASGISLFIYD